MRGQGNPNGNIVWEIRANFNSTGLSGNQQWVFLNAYNWTTLGGSLSALHNDGLSSWDAAYTNAGNSSTDSFVTATGTYGSGTALDPNFNPSTGSSIPALAGWYDATPGTPNAIGVGGSQGGYRILLAQIVRNGNDADAEATFYLKNSFKVAGTTTALFAEGTFTIGVVPAPGAMALLGLAGLAGRRRR